MNSSGAPKEASPISYSDKTQISQHWSMYLQRSSLQANIYLHHYTYNNVLRPQTCENCAKLGSANNGTCPSSSWQMSLKNNTTRLVSSFLAGISFLLLFFYFIWAVYSRFRCVHRLGAVSYVLGWVKHSESETGQEVTRGEETCHRTQTEPGACWENHERMC